jgi:hypothetical protein
MTNKNSYKIIKKLGEGLMGKVYLINKNNKKYALKIEYISSLKDHYLYNELQFIDNVAKKNPEQFIQLEEYNIVKNCDADAPKYPDWLSKREKEWFDKVRSSKLCVEKVYSLVDTSLGNLKIEKMTLGQRYSLLIQTLYINYIFDKNGYIHGDFHKGNIGVIKVDKNKKIDILDYSVPTYGLQYQAIDYGGILHKNSASKKRLYQNRDVSEYQHFKEHSVVDKLGIIGNMYDQSKWWTFVKKNNIMLDFEHDLEVILKQKEIDTLKTISNHKFILFDLYKLIYPKKFQQLILGTNFKKVIEFECYIPIEDIVYCYLNFNNSKIIIKYLINRLNEL